MDEMPISMCVDGQHCLCGEILQSEVHGGDQGDMLACCWFWQRGGCAMMALWQCALVQVLHTLVSILLCASAVCFVRAWMCLHVVGLST